jgi:hypothetical protein
MLKKSGMTNSNKDKLIGIAWWDWSDEIVPEAVPYCQTIFPHQLIFMAGASLKIKRGAPWYGKTVY